MSPAIVLILLIFSGVWLWSLISAFTSKRLSDSHRVIAVILIAILGLIGPLIYLFLPRESVRRTYGRG